MIISVVLSFKRLGCAHHDMTPLISAYTRHAATYQLAETYIAAAQEIRSAMMGRFRRIFPAKYHFAISRR